MERFGHPGLDSGAPAHGAVVMALGHVSRDVRRVSLALDAGSLTFRPGQHVLLSAGGLRPRPYAIASLPDNPLLELHIHRRPTGLGAHAAERMRVGDRAVVWGALGCPFPLEGGAPLLAAADGAALSVVGNAVLAALGANPLRRVTLHAGATLASEVYDARILAWLVTHCPNFSLNLRRSGARRVSVAASIAAARPDLRAATVIIAGTPGMVAGVESLVGIFGAPAAQVAAMPFGPDVAPGRPHGLLARWWGGIARPWIAPAPQ